MRAALPIGGTNLTRTRRQGIVRGRADELPDHDLDVPRILAPDARA
jgi:hypothetical protein